MAKFTHVNIDTTTNGVTQIIFSLLTQMLAAGWTVQTSSDGTTYKATPGSQITVAGSGAGGLANTSAWFRVQDPGGRREFVFQRGATHSSYTVVYSALDRFTGGTPNATTRPTAADEQVLYSAVSLWTGAPGSMYGHVCVQSTPEGNAYGFWCFTTTVGTGANPSGVFLCCEPLAVGSYPAADTDPVVHWVLTSNPLVFGSNAWRWTYKHNLTGEAWAAVTAPTVPAQGLASLVGTIGSNPYDGDDNHFPAGFCRRSSDITSVGWKGWGKYIRIKGTNRSYPDTINLATDAYVHAGDYLIPWEDGTAPLV
jgi:hypothetical protein